MASVFDFNKFGRQGGGGNGQPPVVDQEAQEAAAIIKKGLKRRGLILLLLIAVAFIWTQCVVITRPNEYKVTRQFGEIKSLTTEAGVTFKLPFIQTVDTLPNMIRLYDIPISDVITQDKKTMVADSFVLWRVTDPTKFIRTLSGNVRSAEERLSVVTYNSMKNVISMMEQTDIISGRDTLAQRIFANVGTQLDQYGVDLIGIETKHLDLPDDNKQAVYTRMISERNNIAASYQAEGEEEARMIRTETDKTVSILLSQAQATAAQTIAEGEQRYMEILAEAYNDAEKAEFYTYVRALDAAKESLRNGDTTLILSSDSPIAQVFYNVS